ncbi:MULTISPECIES: PAAR-like domain-containing protein [Neorhizobium]|uniref:PAAR-like domain-containing protein n=1 Tax=Neorhizobium TaxID=1525371 RepID=UPI000CF90098|nr:MULTISPECIES: PAAR-like domain-containing protein [Neorhizobium]
MSTSANVSARKCASNVIASKGPDVCLTPRGSSVVPVPYSSMVTLDKAIRYSTTVRDNGKFDLQLNSAVPGVTGHEPGVKKGVVSPGYKGIALVNIASPFVYSEGFSTWAHLQEAWINRPDPGPREPQKSLDPMMIEGGLNTGLKLGV